MNNKFVVIQFLLLIGVTSHSLSAVEVEKLGSGRSEKLSVSHVLQWIRALIKDVPRDEMISEEDEGQEHLLKYGYYGPQMTGRLLNKMPRFLRNALTKEAVTNYQKVMGMPESGAMDEMTMQMMSVPRCGLSDDEAIQRMLDRENDGRGKRGKRYVLQGSRWRRSQLPLTYRLDTPTERFSEGEQRRAMSDALQYWSDVSGISFREIAPGSTPDMRIGFYRQSHNDRNRFDGRGRVLAHAFYPGRYALAGDAHFDNDENWVIRTRGGQDLLPTAIHEFGHSLGLAHSDVRGAIMWPTAQPFRRNVRLHQDDIDGIQALYGPAEPVEVTTVRPPPRTRRPPTPSTRATPPPPTPPRDTICDGRVDAVLFDSNRETMAFRGNQVYRLLDNGGIADGYPRPISDEYVGYPDNTRVNAAAIINDRMHLFAPGRMIYRADERGVIQEGGGISQTDIGIPAIVDIRAAFDTAIFRKAYLFTDTEYYRYSTNTGAMDEGYPRPVSAWSGLPGGTASLDAVTMWRNGRVYFFYGSVYYRFNIRRGRVDAGYPRTNADNWFGCDA